MIFAPLFIVMLVGCGWWAWSYQQRAVTILRVRPSHAAHRDHARFLAAALPPDAAASPETERVPARVAVQQLARVAPPPPPPSLSSAPSSVLGWEAFSIDSTLVLDGTVLIGCRRRCDAPFVDSRVGSRGLRRVPAARQSDRPDSPASEDGSIVLLIGEDDRATQAVALLEGWRSATATLWLRPTGVAGAIELFDGRANALRASLLAA